VDLVVLLYIIQYSETHMSPSSGFVVHKRKHLCKISAIQSTYLSRFLALLVTWNFR